MLGPPLGRCTVLGFVIVGSRLCASQGKLGTQKAMRKTYDHPLDTMRGVTDPHASCTHSPVKRWAHEGLLLLAGAAWSIGCWPS